MFDFDVKNRKKCPHPPTRFNRTAGESRSFLMIPWQAAHWWEMVGVLLQMDRVYSVGSPVTAIVFDFERGRIIVG